MGCHPSEGYFSWTPYLGVLSGQKGVESLSQILVGHVAGEQLSEVFVSKL